MHSHAFLSKYSVNVIACFRRICLILQTISYRGNEKYVLVLVQWHNGIITNSTNHVCVLHSSSTRARPNRFISFDSCKTHRNMNHDCMAYVYCNKILQYIIKHWVHDSSSCGKTKQIYLARDNRIMTLDSNQNLVIFLFLSRHTVIQSFKSKVSWLGNRYGVKRSTISCNGFEVAMCYIEK